MEDSQIISCKSTTGKLFITDHIQNETIDTDSMHGAKRTFINIDENIIYAEEEEKLQIGNTVIEEEAIAYNLIKFRINRVPLLYNLQQRSSVLMDMRWIKSFGKMNDDLYTPIKHLILVVNCCKRIYYDFQEMHGYDSLGKVRDEGVAKLGEKVISSHEHIALLRHISQNEVLQMIESAFCHLFTVERT